MRICIVSRECPPLTPYSGGIGFHYAAMAPELARQGQEVHYVTMTNEASRTADLDGVTVHLRSARRGLGLTTLTDPLAVAATLRRLGPFDVVFAAEWGGEAAAHSLRRRPGVLVTNLATSLTQILQIERTERPARERIRHCVQRPLERWQTEHSDAIAACSSAILQWARRLWSLDGIPSEVIPNFIDPDHACALATGEPARGFPAERPIVLFFGRLEIRKGVLVLAEAMKRVWRQHPTAQLVLVGDDLVHEGRRMSERMRQLAGPDGGRLHVLGRQPPDRLFPAIAAADAVVFPSVWENFSIAALEAKALGKPIVATTGGGFVDFVHDDRDGLLVAPGDVDGLAAAIERLLADGGLRDRLGRAARASAEEYRPEPVVRRYVEFFERVAGS